MNKRQKLINKVTQDLFKNEEWLYNKRCTSFYNMRKYVKNIN